ncbi:hypothetical protein GCM10027615_63270 [Plantactinospora veratri]
MPSFRYTRARWLSTVLADTTSRIAISRLDRPPAARAATSFSRTVRVGEARFGAGRPRVFRSRPASATAAA